jgi:hypothetical protein
MRTRTIFSKAERRARRALTGEWQSFEEINEGRRKKIRYATLDYLANREAISVKFGRHGVEGMYFRRWRPE